jgi:hypothetical protein
MRPGANLRFLPEDVIEFDPLAEHGTYANTGATRPIQVSMATGRGKDS